MKTALIVIGVIVLIAKDEFLYLLILERMRADDMIDGRMIE